MSIETRLLAAVVALAAATLVNTVLIYRSLRVLFSGITLVLGGINQCLLPALDQLVSKDDPGSLAALRTYTEQLLCAHERHSPETARALVASIIVMNRTKPPER